MPLLDSGESSDEEENEENEGNEEDSETREGARRRRPWKKAVRDIVFQGVLTAIGKQPAV